MRRWLGTRAWLEAAYLLLGLPMGIATFTVVVVGLALGVGLLPVFLLGVPLLVALVVVVHALAVAERWRADVLLDAGLPERGLPPAAGSSALRRGLRRLLSGAFWKETAYALLLLPLACVTGTLPFAFWSAGVALVLLPVYGSHLAGGHVISWLHWPGGLEMLAGFGAGVLALVIARLLTAAFATAHVEIARALLSPSESDQLKARVATLQTSRTRVVQAADDERRRIERDLHDGAQQHLVALAMNLGRAKEKLDSDPDGARALVEQAHQEAKDSITALRNVVRGVHPAVLTDRGLDAALSALAARSPVPVRLDVDVAERPSPTAEAVAYFVVSEALTNVARHARATRVDVHVERDRERLLVAVTDDGRGGAAPTPGSGLAGLRDRLAAVDGSLWVSSPPGGGTTVTAVVPCAC